MARLTTNLKLKISDDLTADAIFNLERIDLLGSIITVGSDGTANLRSANNILIQPESEAVGGSGVGGTVSIERQVQIEDDLYIKDESGSYYLELAYSSSDTPISTRKLTLDVIEDSSLTLPTTGTLATLLGAETFVNKTLTDPAFTNPNTTLNSLLPSQSGQANKYLLTDGTNTTWSSIIGSGSAAHFEDITGSQPAGSFGINHNLDSKDLLVEVYDKTDDSTVITEVIRTDNDNLNIVTSIAVPAAGLRVIVKKG